MQDIIIIGGGIAGLSVGGRLSEEANITLIEAEENLGYHTSSRSAAAFIEDYGNNTIRELNKGSKPYLQSKEVDVLSPRGSLFLGKENEKEAFKRQCIEFAHNEISIADAKNLFEIVNFKTAKYAAYREDILDIDTDKLLQHFTKIINKNNNNIITRSKVTKISFDQHKWHVEADGNSYSSDILVNASGAWADEIAVLANLKPLGLSPLKRSMARVPAPDNVINHKKWPMIHGVDESFYAKPDAGELIISPSEETKSFPHDAWPTEEDLAQGIFNFEEMVTFSVNRITSSWAGLRTFAPDRTLVIGHDPTNPHFFWLAGQGGYGFQTSAAASELASDIILGKKSNLGHLIEKVSPKRFLAK